MSNYYFNADEYDATDGDGYDGEGQRCYPLKRHLAILMEDVLTHVRLYAAERLTGTGDFYCVEFGFWGNTKQPADSYDTCGVRCESYAPCNGISGRCKNSRPIYVADTNAAVLLKRDGSLEPFTHKGLMAQVLGTPGIDLGAAIEDSKRDTRPLVERMEELAQDLQTKSDRTSQ